MSKRERSGIKITCFLLRRRSLLVIVMIRLIPGIDSLSSSPSLLLPENDDDGGEVCSANEKDLS